MFRRERQRANEKTKFPSSGGEGAPGRESRFVPRANSISVARYNNRCQEHYFTKFFHFVCVLFYDIMFLNVKIGDT